MCLSWVCKIWRIQYGSNWNFIEGLWEWDSDGKIN